jgi:colanic acid biosynthesis glycosyl transferase WcaI
MSMRKVLFVNRFFYPDLSATSQILSDLVFDLAKDGFQVEVVTSRLLYDDATADLPALETRNGVLIRRIWSSRLGRDRLAGRAIDYISFYFSACCTLWRHTDTHTIVVAKTDPPLLSIFAAPVARMRRATLINWLQDLFPEVASVLRFPMIKGFVLRTMRAARNASLRQARTNVVLGSRMEKLVRAQGVPREKIRVIPNWADGREIRQLPHGTSPLRSLWALGGKFVVGYSGNLGRAHEFETILDAAALLRARTDIAFVFIGGGAQRKQVEAGAQARCLANVEFHPYQPRETLSLSLAVADVHVVSLNPELEGLIVPSKFYGVAAAGRATLFIGDDSGEIASLLREVECGFSVRPGEPRQCAELIATLADDPALCARLGSNAREVFDQRFDRSIAFNAWRTLLREAPGAEQARTTGASGQKRTR